MANTCGCCEGYGASTSVISFFFKNSFFALFSLLVFLCFSKSKQKQFTALFLFLRSNSCSCFFIFDLFFLVINHFFGYFFQIIQIILLQSKKHEKRQEHHSCDYFFFCWFRFLRSDIFSSFTTPVKKNYHAVVSCSTKYLLLGSFEVLSRTMFPPPPHIRCFMCGTHARAASDFSFAEIGKEEKIGVDC